MKVLIQNSQGIRRNTGAMFHEFEVFNNFQMHNNGIQTMQSLISGFSRKQHLLASSLLSPGRTHGSLIDISKANDNNELRCGVVC